MRRTTSLTPLLLALASLGGCANLTERDNSPAQAVYAPEDTPSALPMEAADGTVFCYEIIVCPLVTSAALPASEIR